MFMSTDRVQISRASRDSCRELILSMHSGILTDVELKALDACIGPTSDLWIGFIAGRPVCAWGLVPPTMLSDRAYLWLYAAPAVDEYKFLFVRYSQRIVEALRVDYPIIEGVCAVENRRAQRWLRWLGAEFGRPLADHIPFTIGGHVG